LPTWLSLVLFQEPHSVPATPDLSLLTAKCIDPLSAINFDPPFQETLDLLESRDIAVHVAETNKPVEIYNDLVQRGQAVGGLFHSAC